MLTRLLALTGGLSPQISRIRLSVEYRCPGRKSRQASSDRHFGALTAVHPSPVQTSRGPRMRKRIRPARPNSRAPPFRVAAVSGNAEASREVCGAAGEIPGAVYDHHLITTKARRKSHG